MDYIVQHYVTFFRVESRETMLLIKSISGIYDQQCIDEHRIRVLAEDKRYNQHEFGYA